ncbi:hypothetical protein CMV_017474 [Castanea mollissima]|uniref:Uncharacterized protein n=1 Tax=Castanea mollissima TaxID=60419 RepID=A0A8J4R1V7_9ROSI|nr:hypothetical protein CMV_017474 [Castanea mollissima]
MEFLDSGKGILDTLEDPKKFAKVEEEFVKVGEYMVPLSMTSTRVVDITKDLLLYWWTSLKMLQTARFEIQFAFNHLKRVAHAYFGLRVKKQVANFDKVLFELHGEVQNLQNNIEALEKKREDIRSADSAKSNLTKECMREATVLKHAIASTGLIRI